MFRCHNCTLLSLIYRAYDLSATYQLTKLNWMDGGARFEISVKEPPDTTKEQFSLMLQNLLAERFRVAIHREKKAMQVYNLVVAKGGPKFKEMVEESEESVDERPPSLGSGGGPDLDKDGFYIVPKGARGCKGCILVAEGEKARIYAETMQQLAGVLSGELERPVLDSTRLTGKYDIRSPFVACTGHWLCPSLSMSARTVEELANFFVLEIERGIEGTDIRSGVIKVATDHEGVTPFLKKALRVAAPASKATGVPITTHTYAADRTGERQAEIFEAEGLNPAMVCLGHCDDTDDMSYLRDLLKRGGARGAPETLSWQQRAQCIKKLVDAGFCKSDVLVQRLVLWTSMAGAGAMEAMEKMNPDGMLFNTRKTIPYLRQLGVTDQQIRLITVENPRRFFGGV